jgi:crossover junction endodeoxyribonuclease RuvC
MSKPNTCSSRSGTVNVVRVLGVDPGLTRCGLGVIEGEAGRTLRLVGTEVVGTESGADIGARLLALEERIEHWLITYQPDAVAIERVFSQHNVRTVMGTAQAGAVAIMCAARRGLPMALHTPSEVKAAVTGSGRADKAQVTRMVTRLLRLADPPRPADAADALALAICHLWRGGAQARLAAAVVLAERGRAAAPGTRAHPGPTERFGSAGRAAPAGGPGLAERAGPAEGIGPCGDRRATPTRTGDEGGARR